MALIQDVQPAGDRKSRSKPLPQSLQDRLLEVHRATNLPHIAEESIRRVSPADTPAATSTVPKPAAATKPAPGRRLLDFAQYPLIAAFALGAAYSPTVGQLSIMAFGILGLGFRLSSRYAFGAALLLLASVPFFQVLHQSGISQNCAIYAYELLVVGTLQAILESFQQKSEK